MQITESCKECFRRQAENVLRLAGGGFSEAVELWLSALEHALPKDRPPSFVGRMLQRRVESLTGARDPFRELRRRSNEFALGMLHFFRARLARSDEPIRDALRLAAAANIIDYGAKRDLTLAEARRAVEEALSRPLEGTDEKAACERLARARSVLIVADNAGEIAFDRLLCEFLPVRPVVAVRAAPVINDAVMEDALHVGLDEVADLTDTGSDLPGVWLPDSSPAFERLFREADVVISKGQGNYEGLSDTSFRGYFLFRVKCEPVAEHAGFPIGTSLLLPARSG